MELSMLCNVGVVDKLAVPDFAFSAMENWGLVTYKEVVLFTDPEYTSSEERRRLVVTNAHELAHQVTSNNFSTWKVYNCRSCMKFTPKYPSKEITHYHLKFNLLVCLQWFGNTVTCAWFDDVWLNEGLASYFEIFPIPTVEPTWDKVSSEEMPTYSYFPPTASFGVYFDLPGYFIIQCTIVNIIYRSRVNMTTYFRTEIPQCFTIKMS